MKNIVHASCAGLLMLCTLLTACGGGSPGADSGTNASGSGGSDTGSSETGGSNTGDSGGSGTGNSDGDTGNPSSALDQALARGDPSSVSAAEIAQSTKDLLSAQTATYAALKQQLFGLNGDGSAGADPVTGLDWNPSHDSSTFTVLDAARNMVLLPSNWSYDHTAAGSGLALAVAGTAPGSGARYAAFSGNPLAVPGNVVMDRFMVNLVNWLTTRAAAADFRIVAAQLPGTETYWFPHESAVRSWFAAHFAGVTINGLPGDQSQADNLCDGSALAGCLQNADLLVIGREQGPNPYDGAVVMQAVTAAQARGIPILYLHHYRDADDLATRLLTYFGLGQSNNYWTIDGLKDFDPSTLPAVPAQLAGYSALITHLNDGTFNTDWSGCSTSGRINCANDAAYMAQLGTLGEQLRTTLRRLDAAGIAIFDLPGYALEKRLVLLGDKYRETVAYPLDKTANEQAFFRALFSDMSAYVHRPYSAVARNLGNFSGLFADDTPTLAQTLSVALPASGSKDYMSGLYVMPGRSVTLTRSDSSGASISFGLNKLRDTTWLFNSNGLDRPTQISSPQMPLLSGQSVQITSPYGGPLFLTLSAASGDAQTVTVTVDGVIAHPLLRDATDPAQVAAFQSAVATTPTNWVGVTTDMLTVNSTLDHFKETMQNYANGMALLADNIWTYEIKDTYELAGFNDASGKLHLAPTVQAYCTVRGWDCTGPQHRRDVMQYVISDVHANCGDGCSGNPYDQDWPFDPLGWGESHEVGHNIQPARLRIYGGRSSEVSNNLFPMHKHVRYNLDHNGQPAPGYDAAFADRAGTVQAVFDTLKQAQSQADPVSTVYDAIWSDASYAADNSARVAFYRQLVEFARYYNHDFSDGWELVTLLYLLDRNFADSAANWATVASGYGFGTYSTYPDDISGNDFMLIATSFIIGRDLRPVFDLWGITYSQDADHQVQAYGHLPAGKLLFPMPNLSVPASGVGTPVLVTSLASYPAGY